LVIQKAQNKQPIMEIEANLGGHKLGKSLKFLKFFTLYSGRLTN